MYYLRFNDGVNCDVFARYSAKSSNSLNDIAKHLNAQRIMTTDNFIRSIVICEGYLNCFLF